MRRTMLPNYRLVRWLCAGQARRVLLLTAETYTKHIHPADRSVRTLFGDAAAAAFVKLQTIRPSAVDRPVCVWH